MKRVLESRLAPAIVVGLIGMIVVAGIAIAGPAISSKKKKGLTARKVSAIADQRIAAAAPNLSVKSAGSLKMFGHVSSTGGLRDASGIGRVTLDVDRYCFSGLAATPRGGNATVDFADGPNGDAQLGLGAGGGCPSGTQAYVVVTDNANTNTLGGFFVEFWS
jgi:hypothetical protein